LKKKCLPAGSKVSVRFITKSGQYSFIELPPNEIRIWGRKSSLNGGSLSQIDITVDLSKNHDDIKIGSMNKQIGKLFGIF
jgi:YbbR domain-containing protein